VQMPVHDTPQLTIVHLSDIHFGRHHRFDPPATPAGDPAPVAGYPTLVETLRKESEELRLNTNKVIVCITGDLSQNGSYDELKSVDRLLRDLQAAPLFGQQLTLEDIFIVPGNHDLVYSEREIEPRWERWLAAYNRWYRTSHTSPYAAVKVHDRVETHGAVVVTINSAILVQKDTPAQDRGCVEIAQLQAIKKALDEIPAHSLHRAIKIALLHHHPVLIPPLAESRRGYDAVLFSGELLTMLRRYGFHLVLHGHKHDPHVFTDDTRRNTGGVPRGSLLIVAGGSAGSRELPADRPNTYNRITVKWHPAAGQWRACVKTQQLVTRSNGEDLLPPDWHWTDLDTDDRSFYPGRRLPPVKMKAIDTFDGQDGPRRAEYNRSRGNMIGIEVLPSLDPDQAYEVRLWIIGRKRDEEDEPLSVTWSAGPSFGMVTVHRDEDANFCASFSYWESMLVQARLEFEKGEPVNLFAFARIPESYEEA
jgi:3',5'-cyclic AMP phosphodiesterase CpdA